MRKTLKNDNLASRPAARAILALSLTASLAAFGCTTNRTPGNGEPLSGAPGVRGTSPTSGANTGSSSGTTTVNPPMTSSSNYSEPLPGVNVRSKKLPLSPDEAAAVLAGNGLDRRVRVLGPSDPARSGRAYASDSVTGQFENPALKIAPIVTINSSVNSAAHVPAIISGASGADTSAITAASTVTGSGNAATVLSPSAAAATPTSAGLPFSAGSFAAGPGSVTAVTPGIAATNASTGTLTPTVASANFPVPTVAGSSITAATGTVRAAGTAAADAVNTAATTGTVSTLGTTNTGTTATTGTAAATTVTNAATTNAATTTSNRAATTSATRAANVSSSATVANPVRISQDASGRVVVSNATSKDKQ